MSLAQLHKPKMTDTSPLYTGGSPPRKRSRWLGDSKAEQEAREAVAGIDEADSILMRRPDRAERTRAGAVDRLEEAVKATIKASRKDPELKEYAQIAARSWDKRRASARLAMSGRRIAHGEAASSLAPSWTRKTWSKRATLACFVPPSASTLTAVSASDLRPLVGSGSDDSRHRPHRSSCPSPRLCSRADPQPPQGHEAL